MKPLNFEIVSELENARKLYTKVEAVIEGFYAQNGKVTFENVQTIAATVTEVGTPKFEALVRTIECKNVITLEPELEVK
jgi:hypothetical protein